jgi:hypothetical protein
MQLIYRGTTYHNDFSCAAAPRPVQSTLKFFNQLYIEGASTELTQLLLQELL